ncbi:MAG: hypothetical protein WA510_15630 [Acidobacteriaceae bacterium]
MSTSPISSSSLLDKLFAATLENTNQATASGAGTPAPATGAAVSGSSTNTTDILSQDLINLLKALVSGDTSAAKSSLFKFQADLKAQAATGSNSSAQEGSPLDSLLANVSNALNSGNTQGALEDVASFLVQNGQSNGSLINTST